MKGIFIEGSRSGYTPEQCGETITVNELIEFLENNFEGNLPIYLYNDNGYTYGEISEKTIHLGEYTEGSGVEFDEDWRWQY